MELRVWRSYSCNNSSDYHLVARFESAERAAEVAKQVQDFLNTYAAQKDVILDEGLDDWDAALATETEIEKELAAKLNFQWTGETPFWGESELVGDEPKATAVADKVFVYHGYCAGGLEFLNPLLSASGGTDISGDMNSPLLGALFALAPGDAGELVRAQLEGFFSQHGSTEYMDQWSGSVLGFDSPRHTDDEDLVIWIPEDGEHLGFAMRVCDESLAAIRKLADSEGVSSAHMTLEDPQLRDKLRRLERAVSCAECKSRLRYIEGDSETPDQMACTDCGGMFALSGF